MRKSTILVAAAAASLAAPAAADVKAGVDAWSRGDYAAAVAQWQGAAAAGDADAQFNLGQAYKLGKGVPADLKKAEELYRLAAEHGHLQAADNYGLLLFQTGRREQAMAWVVPSAERGEPRAEYVLGIAAFNGDLVPRDPVRAYALMSRAAAAGLDQARTSLAVMDQQLSLEQRQQAVAVAAALEARAEAVRGAQLARGGLDSGRRLIKADARPAKPASEPLAFSLKPEPVTAGADYANPVVLGSSSARAVAVLSAVPTARAAPEPVGNPGTPAKPTPAKAPSKPTATPAKPVEKAEAPTPPAAKSVEAKPAPAKAAPKTHPPDQWQVQLGAFGVRSNAEALAAKLKGNAALAGREVSMVPAGKLTRVLAGPFASRSGADGACAALGEPCLVTKR